MDRYFLSESNPGFVWSTNRLKWVDVTDYYYVQWTEGDGRTEIAADEGAIDDVLRAEGLPELSPLPARDIAPLSFRKRFTDSERLAIHTAAITDPQIAMLIADAAAAKTIDVLDQETISGIDALIGAGLLSQERKSEILRRGE